MKALQKGASASSSTPSPSSPVGHLVVAAVGQQRGLALLPLVLNEDQDVAQGEGHLALATGQQVVVGVKAGRQGMGQARVQRVGGQAERMRGQAERLGGEGVGEQAAI